MALVLENNSRRPQQGGVVHLFLGSLFFFSIHRNAFPFFSPVVITLMPLEAEAWVLLPGAHVLYIHQRGGLCRVCTYGTVHGSAGYLVLAQLPYLTHLCNILIFSFVRGSFSNFSNFLQFSRFNMGDMWVVASVIDRRIPTLDRYCYISRVYI